MTQFFVIKQTGTVKLEKHNNSIKPTHAEFSWKTKLKIKQNSAS